MLLTNTRGELVPPGVRSTWAWEDGSNTALPSWLTTNVPAVAGGTGAVYQDDFSTDSPTVINALSPDVGAAYTEDALYVNNWSVVGGRLTRAAVDPGQRSPLRATWNARVGNDFTFTGTMFNVAALEAQITEVLVVSTAEGTARIGIEIGGTGVAKLKKYTNPNLVTLATFTGVHAGVEEQFTLKLEGTTVTATLGADTVTATLSAAEANVLGQDTKTVFRSQIYGTWFDNVQVVAQRTAASTPPTFASTLHASGVYEHGATLPTGVLSLGEYRFTRDLDLSALDAVQMRVEFSCSSLRPGQIKFGFANEDRTRGVEWGFMNSTNDIGYFGMYGPTPQYLATYMQYLGVDGDPKRYTATLTVDCKDGTTYVGMSDGQVNDVWRQAPLTKGLVRPRLFLSNDGVSTRTESMKLNSVQISVWR